MAESTTPHDEAALAILRHAFAHQMVAAHGIDDPALVAAFAAVRRENFLGDAPWSLLRPFFSTRTLERNDPVQLYQDVLVVLDGARGVNNGSPMLHALMLHRLGIRPGDRVLHVGAGGGYYTALLAELAGATGQVTAVEFDPQLAETARTNLAPWRNVTVITGDGAAFPADDFDRIYVNFGIARPSDTWLDSLAGGGTIVFPLAVPAPMEPGAQHGRGAVFALTQTADGLAASFVSRCGFVRAEGSLAGDRVLQHRLHDAFGRKGLERVASFRRGTGSPERCWFWSPDWSLSYDPPIASMAPR